MPERDCKCSGDHGEFIYRKDEEWWSCVACEERVRRREAGEPTYEELWAAAEKPDPMPGHPRPAEGSGKPPLGMIMYMPMHSHLSDELCDRSCAVRQWEDHIAKWGNPYPSYR